MINTKRKQNISSIDIGLEELRTGKVHKYKSIKALISDVWGNYNKP